MIRYKRDLNDSVKSYGVVIRLQMDGMTWNFGVHVIVDKLA